MSQVQAKDQQPLRNHAVACRAVVYAVIGLFFAMAQFYRIWISALLLLPEKSWFSGCGY
jgi:hypothetical protein